MTKPRTDTKGPFVIWVPPIDARLSPNARINWRTKANLIASSREDGYIAALEVLALSKPQWHEVSIKTTFYWPDKRERDIRNYDSNAGLKAYIDGFVDAGLLIKDDKITWLPSEVVHEKGQLPVVKIEVWPKGSDE